MAKWACREEALAGVGELRHMLSNQLPAAAAGQSWQGSCRLVGTTAERLQGAAAVLPPAAAVHWLRASHCVWRWRGEAVVWVEGRHGRRVSRQLPVVVEGVAGGVAPGGSSSSVRRGLTHNINWGDMHGSVTMCSRSCSSGRLAVLPFQDGCKVACLQRRVDTAAVGRSFSVRLC